MVRRLSLAPGASLEAHRQQLQALPDVDRIAALQLPAAHAAASAPARVPAPSAAEPEPAEPDITVWALGRKLVKQAVAGPSRRSRRASAELADGDDVATVAEMEYPAEAASGRPAAEPLAESAARRRALAPRLAQPPAAPPKAPPPRRRRRAERRRRRLRLQRQRDLARAGLVVPRGPTSKPRSRASASMRSFSCSTVATRRCVPRARR